MPARPPAPPAVTTSHVSPVSPVTRSSIIIAYVMKKRTKWLTDQSVKVVENWYKGVKLVQFLGLLLHALSVSMAGDYRVGLVLTVVSDARYAQLI
jgi:hypothetical protein